MPPPPPRLDRTPLGVTCHDPVLRECSEILQGARACLALAAHQLSAAATRHGRRDLAQLAATARAAAHTVDQLIIMVAEVGR